MFADMLCQRQLKSRVGCTILRDSSRTLISSHGSVRGLFIKWHNVIVSSGLVAHSRQANFFPVPEIRMCCHALSEHESHEKLRPMFFYCRRLGTANIVNGLFLPFSSVTHNFSATISLKKEITRTTTSASLSMIRILLCHCNITFADSFNQTPHGEREYSYWIMALSTHGFLTDVKQPKAITR